uniref:UBA domain-containing protein n=1 Tax=Kalanchoe fedtschenkoi TaxID=63787 RepID=A0A7N0RB70_KALFE
MDYDFRNRSAAPYSSQQNSRSSNHPSSLYPTVGQPAAPSYARTSSHHQTAAPSSTAGLGIRVAIKPENRITPPPQLLSQVGDIPRSTFEFDFQLEKRIMAEVEKDAQNWSRVISDLFPSKPPEPTSLASAGSGTDPIVSKYITSGLRGEAVRLAVANYGDNPTKVKEFVDGFNLLREMGFSSSNVAEALVMYDNDTDRAIAHFLSGS